MNFSYKHIWTIVYPVLISLLMEQLMVMTDTAFLGRVGEIELGASALGGVYYMAIFMLGFGFSIGAQILIARRNGEKQFDKIGDIFSQGTLFLLALAAVIFTLSKALSPQILRLLIQSDEIYRETLNYMNWRVYGFFFAFAGTMFRAFFVGTTNTKILTLNAIVLVLSNVLFSYSLIFGEFGMPKLGITGAAIGSSAAELVSLLFFIIYTWFKVDKKKYNMFRVSRFKPRLLFHILKTSIWTMTQAFVSVSTWFLFFIAVEHLGERPLAVSNIIRSISSLLFLTTAAFASTASSLVSNLMGAGKQEQAGALCRKMIKMCYCFVLPLAIVIGLFPTLLLRVYTDNLSLISASVPALLVMTSSYIIAVPANILFNAVSGTGNTRSAFFLELVTLAVYASYTFYTVLYLKVDVSVAWTSEHVYALIMLALSFAYLRWANWQNKKI